MVFIHSNSNNAFYALECVRVRGMCACLISVTREYEFVCEREREMYLMLVFKSYLGKRVNSV